MEFLTRQGCSGLLMALSVTSMISREMAKIKIHSAGDSMGPIKTDSFTEWASELSRGKKNFRSSMPVHTLGVLFKHSAVVVCRWFAWCCEASRIHIRSSFMMWNGYLLWFINLSWKPRTSKEGLKRNNC